jgi:hypothetical protein
MTYREIMSIPVSFTSFLPMCFEPPRPRLSPAVADLVWDAAQRPAPVPEPVEHTLPVRAQLALPVGMDWANFAAAVSAAALSRLANGVLPDVADRAKLDHWLAQEPG